MDRIFVTTILPEKMISKFKLSFAACNFSSNLISGNGFSKVYSIMPANVSHHLSRECYLDGRYEIIYDDLRYESGFLFKIAPFIEQWRLFRKIPKGSSVWFYNLYVLNFLTVLLLLLFKRTVKVNIIELDFTPPKKKFCLMTCFLWLMNRCNAVIRLADSPLFTNTNSVCLAGVTPQNAGTEPLITIPKMEFLLSGVLHPDISSIPMILDAFARVPNCTLHITGSWEDMQLMDSYTSKYPNIIYHGVIPFLDYLDLLHSVTFQLSLRNPNWGDNSCNFPSKVIEALLHNRIVISTIHYSQIDSLKYIETERTVEGFVDTLVLLTSMTPEQLLQYANQGQKTIELFSADVWNKWMNKLES